MCRNVVNYDCAGTDHRPLADGHVLDHRRSSPDKTAVADLRITSHDSAGIDIDKISYYAIMRYRGVDVHNAVLAHTHSGGHDTPRGQTRAHSDFHIPSDSSRGVDQRPCRQLRFTLTLGLLDQRAVHLVVPHCLDLAAAFPKPDAICKFLKV